MSIADPSLSGFTIFSYSNDYAEGSDLLRFLRLDNDGNLRIYSSGRGSATKTARWAIVEDQCQVFGYYGNMGICSYNDTTPIWSREARIAAVLVLVLGLLQELGLVR